MRTRPLLTIAASLLLTQFLGCRADIGWHEEHDIAVTALAEGQLETAREHLSISSRKAEQAGESDVFFERSMLTLARVQRDSGMLEDAEHSFRRAYLAREERLGRDSAELAEILTPLAEVCEARGNDAVAENMREHLATITREG